MFKILLLMAPAFIRNKSSDIIRWICYVSAAVALSLFAYIFHSAVQTAKRYESELAQSKNLIAMHDKKIQEQLEIVKKMNETIRELKISHEITSATVVELQQEQQRVEFLVQDKKRVIDSKLRQIDELNIPQAVKEIRKSQTLIKGLNETYCELFSVACSNGGG